MFQDGPSKCGRLKGFILKKQLTGIVKDLVSRLVPAGIGLYLSLGVIVCVSCLLTHNLFAYQFNQ